MYIRLSYALCGSQVDSQLTEIFQGTGALTSAWGSNLGQISATQLGMINALHMKTIKEEERLSNRMAGLQENIADHPIPVIAKRLNRVGEPSEEIDRALDEQENCMANMLQEADKLRLRTLKELLDIFTPLQGVDFLAAGKKLHLCLHQWGKTRDNRHGRNWNLLRIIYMCMCVCKLSLSMYVTMSVHWINSQVCLVDLIAVSINVCFLSQFSLKSG